MDNTFNNQNEINKTILKMPLNTRVITKDIFNEMEQKDIYYKNRWEYIEDIRIELLKMNDCFNILEIGPYTLPLVKGEDVIDINESYREKYPYKINKFIHHNCSTTPYPIKDKEYDLVIACQVLEHLGIYGEQKKVFDELERISKKTIISLPYKWFIPNSRDHHMIDEKVIEYWASGREPTYEKISGNRIIQIYEFK